MEGAGHQGIDAREIIRQIEALPFRDRQQIVRWLWTRVEESPEMLEFVDEGIRSIEEGPLIPAEEVRRKIGSGLPARLLQPRGKQP